MRCAALPPGASPPCFPISATQGRTAKSGRGTPISAKLVANLITEAGANRVLTVDLHAGQIQGFFDIPTDNLYAQPPLVKDILDHLGGEHLMVVSPDVGGVVRARALAKRIGADLAIVDKRRERAGESEVMNIIGDVRGRTCLLVDDIIDSGGTICNAAEALLKNVREGPSMPTPPMACFRRRRCGAHPRFQAQIAGDHGFHSGDGRSAQLPQHPPRQRGAAVGRSHPAHLSGSFGVQPVRLSACSD